MRGVNLKGRSITIEFVGGEGCEWISRRDEQTREGNSISRLDRADSTSRTPASRHQRKRLHTVASNKGNVRMFDRLGIIAKTNILALGDPITGLDITSLGVTAEHGARFRLDMNCATWEGVMPSRRGCGLSSLAKDLQTATSPSQARKATSAWSNASVC